MNRHGYSQDGPEHPKWTSICPGCFKEVSNKVYFAGRKGSAHFRGTCSISSPYGLKAEDIETVAERDARPIPYPMPPPVNYDAVNCKGRHYTHVASCYEYPRIETYADLAKWWGLPTLGEVIKRKALRATRTLAQMGLAA